MFHKVEGLPLQNARDRWGQKAQIGPGPTMALHNSIVVSIDSGELQTV